MSDAGGANAPMNGDGASGPGAPAGSAAQQRPHVRIEMLSNPLYLSGAREMVSSIAHRLGLSDVACSQVALAVDEALCNVIKHGYDRRPDAPIWLSIWPLDPVTASSQGSAHGMCHLPENEAAGDAAGIKIVIEDEARQVDPETIRSRDLEDVRPGGLGVHIIREVMDEAIYEKRGVCGMKLTLVKRHKGK